MVCAQSGHGKSSFLNFIYGSNLCFDGKIMYHDNVSDPFLFRRDKLSYVFQDLCLFNELTALENVQLKNNLTHYKSDHEIITMLERLLPSESHIDHSNAMMVAELITEEVNRQGAGLIVTALDAIDLFNFDTTLNL